MRLPNNYDVIYALYRLAIYTFNNFEVPKSHYDYITNHIKGIQIGKNQSETVNSILEHWKKVDDIFGIELELRAIEVVYSYGNFPVTNEAYIITLIDEIRKGINRKEPMEYKHYGLTPPDVYNELIKRIPGLKN